MYERFTDRSRKVMQLANQEALRFNHEYVGTEHILLGLIKEGSGVAANVLKNLDIDLRKIRQEIEKIVQSGPEQVLIGRLPQTPRSKKVIEYSIVEAQAMNHNFVGTEHLLLGLLHEEEGVAAQVLMNLGLKLDDVREEVLNLLGHNTIEAKPVEVLLPRRSKTPALDSFGRDLVEWARQGKCPVVVGREQAIEKLFVILDCQSQNSVALIGDAGVGRTALVQRLAERIAHHQVPQAFHDQRVIELDMGLVTSTERRQVDERLKAIGNEIARAKNVILVLHGARQYRQLIRNSYLALQLERGPLRIILTVNDHEWNKLQHESLFDRRFSGLTISQLSLADVREAMRQNRDRIAGNCATIGDSAIDAVLEEYSSLGLDEMVPGRAVLMLHRTIAHANQRNQQQPPPWTELESEMARLDQEKESAVIEQDFDQAAKYRDQCDKIRKQLRVLRDEWEKQTKDRLVIEANDVRAMQRLMWGEPESESESNTTEGDEPIVR